MSTPPPDHAGRAELRVTIDGRVVLAGTLALLAGKGRLSGPELLPFLYRDAPDPDDPDDTPGPLRRARLMVVEDTVHTTPTGPGGPAL